MEDPRINKWKEVRSKGAYKYIISRGIISGLIIKFIPDLVLRKKIVFSDVLTWIELGIAILVFSIFSLLDWTINEFKYKKYIK